MFPLFDLLEFWYFAQHWIQFIVLENMLDKNRRIIQEWTIQKYSQQDTGRKQAIYIYILKNKQTTKTQTDKQKRSKK